MTVNQLIKTLARFHADTPVLVEGYEGGYDDISPVDMGLVIMNANVPPGSCGPHSDWDGKTPRPTPCVILKGEGSAK